MVKVRSASRVYRRFYWLEEETMQLKWEPSKKDSDKARVLVQLWFSIKSHHKLTSKFRVPESLISRKYDFSKKGLPGNSIFRKFESPKIWTSTQFENLSKDIHEVRSGKNSEVFLSVDTTEHFPEECAFSIVYGEDYLTLDLVAATTEEANIWCTGLRCLISGKDVDS